MREAIAIATLFLLYAPAFASNDGLPAGWKITRDAKGICQIAAPADWAPLGESSGAVAFQSPSTAIAVVTSQKDQDFKPLDQRLQKTLALAKEKLFENSPKRVFYQDRVAAGQEDQNSYSASVPGKTGTCSCRVAFVPSVGAETAKKIVMSLGPAAE